MMQPHAAAAAGAICPVYHVWGRGHAGRCRNIRNRNVGCEIRIVVSSGASHLACGAFLNWLGFCLHC